ncbi:hypothetical protein L916_05996, partial [Phytophthora nicotianae]
LRKARSWTCSYLDVVTLHDQLNKVGRYGVAQVRDRRWSLRGNCQSGNAIRSLDRLSFVPTLDEP